MAPIKKATTKINSFSSWLVDQRVAEKVKATCFGMFLDFKSTDGLLLKEDIELLTRLGSHWDSTEQYFKFKYTHEDGSVQDHLVDFGLQDVLYITGLPIDGTQVSGMDYGDSTTVIAEHLSLSVEEVSSLLSKTRGESPSGMIELKKLKEKFHEVPVNISEDKLESYVIAYILYLLGCVLFPNTSCSISHFYLPLLRLDKINSYAWGSAVHARIKYALNKSKACLDCFSYLLTVFCFERFASIRRAHSLAKPLEFPLFLSWSTVLEKPLRDSAKSAKLDYATFFVEMEETDIDWQPYERIQLPEQLANQEWMIYFCGYSICFDAIVMLRTDACYKQLGLEEGNIINCITFDGIRKKKQHCKQVSRHRDKNWTDFHVFYKKCNVMWLERRNNLVNNYSQTADQANVTQNEDADQAHSPVVDAINEPENVIDNQGDCGIKAPVSSSEPEATSCAKACPVTTCFSPQSDNSQSWPFTKKSEMWKVYESMEIFKRIPQAPHFSPLNKHEEKSREKLALGMMSNFSYEAERISARSPDDLNTSRTILDSLKSLEELESHGFNVTPLQDYLTQLLSKMEKEKELNGELEEIESGIINCRNEKTAIEVKLSELDKQLKSLEEKIECENSMIRSTDLQLAELESQRGIVSKELHKFQRTKRYPFEG